jgi:hypothetical protein
MEGGTSWERGAAGKNDPNNVCTCEQMNNKKFKTRTQMAQHLRERKNKCYFIKLKSFCTAKKPINNNKKTQLLYL